MALFIKRRFGVHLSVWAVGRYLPRRGFPPQKPARRVYLIIARQPVHRSLKVKNWVKENEERIRLIPPQL